MSVCFICTVSCGTPILLTTRFKYAALQSNLLWLPRLIIHNPEHLKSYLHLKKVSRALLVFLSHNWKIWCNWAQQTLLQLPVNTSTLHCLVLEWQTGCLCLFLCCCLLSGRKQNKVSHTVGLPLPTRIQHSSTILAPQLPRLFAKFFPSKVSRVRMVCCLRRESARRSSSKIQSRSGHERFTQVYFVGELK